MSGDRTLMGWADLIERSAAQYRAVSILCARCTQLKPGPGVFVRTDSGGYRTCADCDELRYELAQTRLRDPRYTTLLARHLNALGIRYASSGAGIP
jgi:hypothetical protein